MATVKTGAKAAFIKIGAEQKKPSNMYIKVNGVWKKVIKLFMKNSVDAGGVVQPPSWGEVPLSAGVFFFDGFILQREDYYTEFYGKDKTLSLRVKDDSFSHTFSKDGYFSTKKIWSDSTMKYSYEFSLMNYKHQKVWTIKTIDKDMRFFMNNKGVLWGFEAGMQGADKTCWMIDSKTGTLLNTFNYYDTSGTYSKFTFDEKGNLISLQRRTGSTKCTFRRFDDKADIIETFDLPCDYNTNYCYPIYEDDLYYYYHTDSELFKTYKSDKTVKKSVSPANVAIKIKGGFMCVQVDKYAGGSYNSEFKFYDEELNLITSYEIPVYNYSFGVVRNIIADPNKKGSFLYLKRCYQNDRFIELCSNDTTLKNETSILKINMSNVEKDPMVIKNYSSYMENKSLFE